MYFTLVTAAYLAAGLAVFVAGYLLFKKRLGRIGMITGALVIAWLFIFSCYIAKDTVPATEQISITALDSHSKASTGNFFIISGYKVDHDEYKISYPTKGAWAWYDKSGNNDYVLGWVPGTKVQPQNATNEISLNVPIGKRRMLEFYTYPWGGMAKIETSGGTVTLDAYSSTENAVTLISIPNTSDEMITRSQWVQFPCFITIFLLCCLVMFMIVFVTTKEERLNKLDRYRFLFSQLVQRDFTLKYKRTILGMFWSILNPLFNLLIMYIVFNKLLGSNVDHFAIYLFAGQLVYSYFCDATSQGMTSLLENSGIFTKINVPKYMFLLSKNVSSLINFALTLILFFIFVACEGIPFTWKFLLLLYPIGCMVVFNIGVGLILSALFVFFRDMQYLWGIITQIIMWLSAIFYTIDSYPQIGQNLFLLNPIYLFIRYFRKIVLDGTVPSIWFHLMIAGYTILVLLVGCRMYKKNNHEFLYYI